jgi:hypothetical protein
MDQDEIPVLLSAYKLSIVEPPCPKTKQTDDGRETVVVNRDGVTQFVVSLFAKLRPVEGRRSRKGAEVRVTLETDPGDGFPEGAEVELISPRVRAYQMGSGENMRSGLSFKAAGLTPAHTPRPSPARSDDK